MVNAGKIISKKKIFPLLNRQRGLCVREVLRYERCWKASALILTKNPFWLRVCCKRLNRADLAWVSSTVSAIFDENELLGQKFFQVNEVA